MIQQFIEPPSFLNDLISLSHLVEYEVALGFFSSSSEHSTVLLWDGFAGTSTPEKTGNCLEYFPGLQVDLVTLSRLMGSNNCSLRSLMTSLLRVLAYT